MSNSASPAKSEFLAKVAALDPTLASPEQDSKVVKLAEELEALVEDLPALNTKLTPLTYLDNISPSISDVSLYCSLYPSVSVLDKPSYYSLPSVTRYFDQIQHLPPVTSARALLPTSPFVLVEFVLDNMPPTERKVEVKVKKSKAGAAAAAGEEGKEAEKTEKKGKSKSTATPAEPTPAAAAAEPVPAAAPPLADAAAASAAPAGKSGVKKEKKEKKPQPAKEEPVATGPAPSMIDLRVGRVLEVSKHPDAESLYVEKIDLGEETGPRTVCSGLVAYMKEEDILGKDVIVVCNLKPVTMRGVKSFAMLLCATSAEGKDAGIEFVNPPAGSKAGERVYFEGEKYESATPEALLNPKKKVFETIQPGFITLDTLEAAWIDPESKSVHKIRTKDGVCKVAKFAGASLS